MDGKKKELKVKLTDIVQPGDTIVVGGEVFLMTDYSFDGEDGHARAEAGDSNQRQRTLAALPPARTRAIRLATSKCTSSTT